MLIYCDSCILIYYYDHTGILNARCRLPGPVIKLRRVTSCAWNVASSR